MSRLMANEPPDRRWEWGGASATALAAGAAVMLPNGGLHIPGSIPLFLLGAGLMLAGYYLAVVRAVTPPWIIGLTAVVVRLILLGQAPSDDIYRYIWEGQLLLEGINPYVHAPDAAELAPLRGPLWEFVQHKPFSAIYPPLAEWSFALLAWFSPSVLFFKAGFAAADLLTGALLWRRYGGQAALVYLWNPLVIYSFAGGGHYDSIFLLALVLGWLTWEKSASHRSFVLLGAAVALKWMALPILAWAVWQVWRDRGARLAAAGAAASAVPFLASWTLLSLCTGEWTGRLYPEKFAEYARSAELVPGIVEWAWPESRYHNSWFLPPLALAWAVVLFKVRKFVPACEWSLFLALVLSPLVHAWYFTWLAPFAVASRNRGTLLLAASGFVYFLLYHQPEPGPHTGWTLRPWETALLWMPFVLGFLGSYLGRAPFSAPKKM